MDTNALVIASGLVAALVAWGAVQDAGASSAPASMQWKFGESWTTSTAAVAAVGTIGFINTSNDDAVLLFGLMLLVGPVLYKGLASSGGASMPLFFAVGTVMGWATIAILAVVSSLVFDITRSGLSLVPRLALNAFMIAALLGAVMSVYRALHDAASGKNLAASGAWTLP